MYEALWGWKSQLPQDHNEIFQRTGHEAVYRSDLLNLWLCDSLMSEIKSLREYLSGTHFNYPHLLVV